MMATGCSPADDTNVNAKLRMNPIEINFIITIFLSTNALLSGGDSRTEERLVGHPIPFFFRGFPWMPHPHFKPIFSLALHEQNLCLRKIIFIHVDPP